MFTIKKFSAILFGSFFSISSNLYSTNKPTVNVLTWFGYLKSPEILKLVDEECGVTLSYDEYYSNEEFLRRWKAQKDNYDILIFANLLYKGIKNEISLKNSDLASISKKYHPIIKKHYDAAGYPTNTVFFSHSLMGFLWNPKKVHLSENDDMFTIFKKAGKNHVILIDDPIEVRNMIHLGLMNKNKTKLNLKNLKNLVQSSDITLSNDYNKIYKSPNFAFSYLWSGEAVIDIKKSEMPYKFLIHPKTSFVCTDLLTVMNNNTHANCVAKALISPKAMNILQNANYYFSPYGDVSQITDPLFKEIYQKTFAQLQNFSWIQPVSLDEFNQLNHVWKTLKLNIRLDKNEIQPM